MMANNECLNMKLDKLILEVECLKNMLKENERETVENNETIQMDENNDGGEEDKIIQMIEVKLIGMRIIGR